MQTEVLVALIGGLSIVLVALIQSQRTMRRQVSEVHESTVNSHGTDLRHDVDRALDQGKRTLQHLTDVQATQARVLLALTDVRAEQERQHRALDEHMTASTDVVARLEARDQQLDTAIASLSEALPIVARSTPPPEGD
jgi:hypothetical protein